MLPKNLSAPRFLKDLCIQKGELRIVRVVSNSSDESTTSNTVFSPEIESCSIGEFSVMIGLDSQSCAGVFSIGLPPPARDTEIGQFGVVCAWS